MHETVFADMVGAFRHLSPRLVADFSAHGPAVDAHAPSPGS
jgi:hypothetical protein